MILFKVFKHALDDFGVDTSDICCLYNKRRRSLLHPPICNHAQDLSLNWLRNSTVDQYRRYFTGPVEQTPSCIPKGSFDPSLLLFLHHNILCTFNRHEMAFANKGDTLPAAFFLVFFFYQKFLPVYKVNKNFEILNSQSPSAASHHSRSTKGINTGEKAENTI